MSKTRPYKDLLIPELEVLFEDNKNDSEVLYYLYKELLRRTKPRSVKLREAVNKHIKREFPELLEEELEDKKKIKKVSESNVTKKAPKKDRSNVSNRISSSRSNNFSKKGIKEEPPKKTYSKDFSFVDPPDKARNKPAKFIFEKKETAKYKLNLSEDASFPETQKIALDKMIEEMISNNKNKKTITLYDGKKVESSIEKNIYSFSFEERIEVFEGAEVTISISGQASNAKVTSLLDKHLLLELDTDYGNEISSCFISLDKTALPKKLSEKIDGIEKGSIENFNFDLLDRIFFSKGSQKQPELEKNAIGLKQLNKEQKDFVLKSLANESLFLWGPPGTGKTYSIGVLIENLFRKKEKSLLASNTNQAVDQVLLKLCQTLGKDHKAIKEGYVLRRGRIDHPELREEWSEYIELDSIVEKKSSDLKEKAKKIEDKLSSLNKKTSILEKDLAQFLKIDEVAQEVSEIKESLEVLKKEVSSDKKAIQENKKREKTLKTELKNSREAGAIRKLFLKNEETILAEIGTLSSTSEVLKESFNSKEVEIEDIQGTLMGKKKDLTSLIKEVKDKDRKKIEVQLKNLNIKRGPLEDDLSEIRKEIEGIQKKVLAEAKVIGATVTKTYLNQDEFRDFDNVIIDEASMVMLPALMVTVGLASKRCIISGDFRQLDPIVETDEKEIFETIGKNIFEFSGLEEKISGGKRTPSNMVMLTNQYRMDEKICNLINPFMYRGKLKTDPSTNKQILSAFPEPLNNNLLIIDSSKIFSFSQKPASGKSKYNLMHALAARNIVDLLHREKLLTDNQSLGICAPFAPQARIIDSLTKSYSYASSGTVHRFQGDEKRIMIIDTVDALGENSVGYWAGADLPTESGAKLWNVAISRSRNCLILISNLTFFNKHLPKHSFLRKIIFEMQDKGKVIDIEEVLALKPIEQDLKEFGKKFELDANSLKHNLFGNQEFTKVCLEDLANAKKSIAIYSGFVTRDKVRIYHDLFRSKINEGVKIRCITRPPDNQGSMKEEIGKDALDALEGIGCKVDTRMNFHSKAVIVDDEIIWLGSCNPLSHTASTEETMTRQVGKDFAKQLAEQLAINFSKDVVGLSVKEENPRCESCGSRTAYNTGKYGPYFKCEGCGETINKYKSEKKKGFKTKSNKKVDKSKEGKPCPKEGCDGKLELRTGRFGPFYGCSNFKETGCKGKS